MCNTKKDMELPKRKRKNERKKRKQQYSFVFHFFFQLLIYFFFKVEQTETQNESNQIDKFSLFYFDSQYLIHKNNVFDQDPRHVIFDDAVLLFPSLLESVFFFFAIFFFGFFFSFFLSFIQHVIFNDAMLFPSLLYVGFSVFFGFVLSLISETTFLSICILSFYFVPHFPPFFIVSFLFYFISLFLFTFFFSWLFLIQLFRFKESTRICDSIQRNSFTTFKKYQFTIQCFLYFSVTCQV